MKPLPLCFYRAGAIGLVVAFAACNSDSTSPDRTTSSLLDRDVAVVAAEAAGEDLDLMTDPGMVSLGPSLATAAGDFHTFGCAYNSQTQRVECPPFERHGLTIIRSFQFKDASGQVQQVYDAVTTASANFQSSVEGNISWEWWSGDVKRHRDFTATGLAGNETQRTWNGTGDGQVSHSRHSDNGETRTYDMTYDTQVQNVVVPFPRTAWPLSGSIARHVVVKIVGGPHDGETRDRTTVVTFNGTELVPIQVNGKTYTLDLKTRRIVHNG